MNCIYRWAAPAGLLLIVGFSTGCNRYGINRYYDFRDMLALGVGIATENPGTGFAPPSLGVYLEVTDFVHLGAITHNGLTAESDLRGSFAGPERRTRFGFAWWQMLRIQQDYAKGTHNVFKDPEFPWVDRMGQYGMRYRGHPAKRLNYEYFSHGFQQGMVLLPRGWHYWEYIGAEVAISEPFLTHFGVMVKFGFDVSELSDFILGIFNVDFKKDDLSPDEYAVRERLINARSDAAPAQAAPAETAPAQAAPEDGA